MLFSCDNPPQAGALGWVNRAPSEQLRVMALRGILMNMGLTPEDRRRTRKIARLTPRERLERFAALQRQAMQLLAASPEGYRRYWARNLRQRSIHAKY
jgi:hypothetical protein